MEGGGGGGREGRGGGARKGERSRRWSEREVTACKVRGHPIVDQQWLEYHAVAGHDVSLER